MTPTDSLLTAQQVAETLAVPVRWVTDHSVRLPFRVVLSERNIRYSSNGLQKWLTQKSKG